ncbi:hypothetical protein [Fluviicola sp.]|uniref:hypothetical protein n=1 Tax=Fluviicola sp. TaxID=1917219 RepID=UPI003D2D59A1
MLTGTIGCVLLVLNRKKIQSADKLSFKQWVLVFLSLFWLRQVTNSVTWLGGYLINGAFSQESDELKIAAYLGLPVWSILIFTATLGFLILVLVIFKFIPSKQRLIFMISGLTGGITGYLFWLVLFGKYIMP